MLHLDLPLPIQVRRERRVGQGEGEPDVAAAAHDGVDEHVVARVVAADDGRVLAARGRRGHEHVDVAVAPYRRPGRPARRARGGDRERVEVQPDV